MGEKRVRLRMGMHNCITAERFHIIKGAIADGMAGPAIEKKYNIKRTTLSYIRKARSYYEYQLLTERLPRAKKMPKVYGEKSGLPFEDYGYAPIFFSIKKVKPTDSSRSNRLDHEAIKSAEVLGWLLVGALFLVMAILIKLAGL